ncbi:MAG: carbohydrate ABC transporter permease [Caldilineaceae bacterium]|nr:carbohydrate ABC transporter permease [Caldilineaceae bacterium]
MKTAVPLHQQTTESGGLWAAHARPWAERFLIYGFLLVFAIITGAPFFYMISGSFKFNAEIFSYPLTFIPRAPTLDNYGRLLSGSEIPYVRQFGNSVIVAVSQTLLTLLISSLVGWGFAKFEFSGKRALFLFLLATLMFPYQVTLVPLFLLMLRLGWLDTYLAIVIPGAISAFGVFFMRQNMLAIPDELIDAARMDGASDWGIYWRIGLPLARGALSVLAVLVFLGSWNDYLWPLIVLRSADKFTYPVGLATLVGLYRVEYGMILSGAFLATLPVVAIFVAGRKYLLENIAIGAIKG